MSDVPAQEVARLRRMRAITENIWFWQGLRVAPLSLVFLATGVVLGLDKPDSPLARGAVVAATAVSLVLIAWAGTYYRRAYGHVSGVAGLHERRSRIKWSLVYPAMFASLIVDFVFALPIFVTGVVWALSLLLYRASTGGGRQHYYVIAAALFVLTFAPLYPGFRGVELAAVFFYALAACYGVAGVLDDLELRRHFAPAPGNAA